MAPRVLVTGLWHETNSFAREPTDLAAFEAYQLVRGAAMADAFAGTNTEIGGMIGAAGPHGLELVFGLFAGAVPSGLVTAEAFAALARETCARAGAAGPLDGLLVALHGAMVADGEDDADAALLARLRAAVGPEVPLVATFDIHANLSPALFAAADLLIGYDTYPHTDMAERGAEAAACLAGIIASGRRPAKALRKLPLLTVPQVQATAESVAVVAYGVGDTAVDAGADRLAASIWARRHEFLPALLPAEEAVRRAMAAAAGPVVLVDVADNVGGGAPGDGTVLLQALLAAGAQDAVVVLWAPEAAGACLALGAGARFQGEVGGSDGRHGPALALSGTIRRAGAVEYRRRSSYMTGQLVRLGAVAVLEAGGVQVVLTERRAMPFDADHLRVLDIVPEAQQILVCKSAIGWRAAFGAIARAHLFVDTPGICASDLHRFAYGKGQHAMFPLDPAASWPRRDG